MDAHISQCHRQYGSRPEPSCQTYHQSTAEHAFYTDEIVGIEQFEQPDQLPSLPSQSTNITGDVHLRIEVEELRCKRYEKEHRQQHDIDEPIDAQVFARTLQAE